MEYVTIGELAELTKIPSFNIRNWEKAGLFPQAQRLGARRLRVWHVSDVPMILAACEVRRRTMTQGGERVGQGRIGPWTKVRQQQA